MSYSYTSVKGLLQRRDPIRSQNVSLAFRFTQERCQQVAAEVAVILGKHGEWDVLAANGSYHRLNMLSKELEVLKAHHDLLFSTLNLVPVLLRKPAEHESPTSIIIPAFSEEWTIQFTATQWAEYEALQERQEIAFAAAQKMESWSRDYAESFGVVQEALRSMKERSMELLDYQVSRRLFEGPGFLFSSSEELPDVEDGASTQSTMDITTPTEDRSNVGSEATEIGRLPAITRHSLQLCGYATASFLRLADETCQNMRHSSRFVSLVDGERAQRLHEAYRELVIHLLHGLDAPMPCQIQPSRSPSAKIEITEENLFECVEQTRIFLEQNNTIERSFGHLPGSTPVDVVDIEAMHRAYDRLVRVLCDGLDAYDPLQDICSTSRAIPVTATAPASPPAPEISGSVFSKDHNAEIHVDKALQAIIDSVASEPTEEDIMKLVFYWTTLDQCNGFSRLDVMKLD